MLCIFTFKYNINDFADLESHSIKSISDTLDVYYIADTYGVYEHEWYELQGRPAFSKKIYGGAIMNDFALAKVMLEQEKLVIGESNFLASPTPYKVRVKFQEFGASSLDIMVLYYVSSTKWDDFIDVKEDINFKIMEIVKNNNCEFAFPSTTVYLQK